MVLIAEDDMVSREVCATLLQQAGLKVELADDGLQALAMSREHPYALILMDMQMPQMNGVEATRGIRHDLLNRHTPILALTANAFEEDREQCLQAGMDGHLTKPIEALRLFQAVLDELDRAPGVPRPRVP